MNPSVLARRALLGSILAVSLAGPAAAATLELRGPDGTEVRIDGTPRGTLPLPAPLEVGPGEFEVECRLVGHLVHRERVRPDAEDQQLLLEIELRPLERRNSVTYSAVLAGLGQLYQRRPVKGWTMMGLQVGAWMVAGWAQSEFQTHRDDYEILDRRYQDAITPSVIASLRAQRDAAWDDLESAETVRNGAVVAAVAIGLWSVFDAWKAHDGFFGGVSVEPAPAAAAGSIGPQLRLGWRVGF